MSLTGIHKGRKSKLKRLTAFDVGNYLFFILLTFIFFYPIWYCVVSALSSAEAVERNNPLFWPQDVTFQAFEVIFNSQNILLYYRNSVFYAVAGTAISLMLTSLMAYPFIVEDFRGKKWFNLFMVIPMFFGGGLIPTYFLITSMGLKNSIWVMLLPGAVGGYNMIIYRTFFKSIPESLREAAYIDGAGHYRTLFTIIMPLSKALFATFGLFTIVGKWNDWFTPFLYLTKDELRPIQLYLRNVLIASVSDKPKDGDLYSIFTKVVHQNVKSATVLITIIPVMCVYPFVQKHFAKGVMIGAIKS